MKHKIICFGPGPQFKGGLADYNTSLAKACYGIGEVEVHIVSWTQQYPGIIPREFKDLKSKNNWLEGTRIRCSYLTNYNNPLSWKNTADYMAGLKPDIIIFQWSIALQGLPLYFITKRLKKKSEAEIIFDLHFLIQKEHSKVDTLFTRMGLKWADAYVVHALKTYRELASLYKKRDFKLTEKKPKKPVNEVIPVIRLYHPVYELFKPKNDFNCEAFKKQHGLQKYVFLFFGFIRKYKGLHQAIRAFDIVARQRNDVSLLICGESFWDTVDKRKWSTKIKSFLFRFLKKILLKKGENEHDYRPLDLIDTLGLHDRVVVFNQYVPNEEVHRYFQVSDCSVLFYLTATPSGIESLSYNFGLPILATRVGHFPETIREGVNGYLAEKEDINSMAEQMLRMIENPIPAESVKAYAARLSWENYARAILNNTY